MYATNQPQLPARSKLVPYQGSSAHFCAACGGFDIPLYQVNEGRWRYSYYCCFPPAIQKPVAQESEPQASKPKRVRAPRPKTEKRSSALTAVATSPKARRVPPEARKRIPTETVLLGVLAERPLEIQEIQEITQYSRSLLNNVLPRMKRQGLLLQVKQRGYREAGLIYYGLVAHTEQMDAIANSAKVFNCVTARQQEFLGYLSEPRSLRTLARHFGVTHTSANDTLTAIETRGHVVRRVVRVGRYREHWFAKAGDERLHALPDNGVKACREEVLLYLANALPTKATVIGRAIGRHWRDMKLALDQLQREGYVIREQTGHYRINEDATFD